MFDAYNLAAWYPVMNMLCCRIAFYADHGCFSYAGVLKIHEGWLWLYHNSTWHYFYDYKHADLGIDNANERSTWSESYPWLNTDTNGEGDHLPYRLTFNPLHLLNTSQWLIFRIVFDFSYIFACRWYKDTRPNCLKRTLSDLTTHWLYPSCSL